MDLALLSRLQFAFTISFHILFPAFSIGLAVFILVMEAAWLKTKNKLYLYICKFWTKIFALTFGMGVVSGIVMEFQLGTNFSGFTYAVGGVLGALFTYEVMTAFFIEAGFLGVMIFGWNRVPPKLHFLSTFLVVVGTTISAYWIMCANTWMQHPVGYQEINGIFQVKSWAEILTNPLLPSRFFHMLLSAYISTALVISSISAYYILHNEHELIAKKCFSFIWLIFPALISLQIFIGDLNGEKIHQYQPLKTAAIEGIWDSGKAQPFIPFAIPNQAQQTNFYSIKIPYGASIINTHQLNGEMSGLKAVPISEQPPILPVFFGFRVMLYIGFALLGLGVWSIYLRFRKQLFSNKLFLKICVGSSPLGFIALWAGWITAETGRQPWVVYHLLKTADAVSKVTISHVVFGFILIFIVYIIIFGFFYFYYLHHILKKGPEKLEDKILPFPYLNVEDTGKDLL